MKKEKVVGYTTGVYDLFHVGHLRLIKRAKEQCDKLIVGVTVDELVSYKHKKAVIPFEERFEIIKSLKYVDQAVPQVSMDKLAAWRMLNFNILFVGDDWKGTKKWDNYEKQFKKVNVKITYFPYTKGISSTLINDILLNIRNDNN